MATTKKGTPRKRAPGAGRKPLSEEGTALIHMRWPQPLADAARAHIEELNADASREPTDLSAWVRGLVRRELAKQGALGE